MGRGTASRAVVVPGRSMPDRLTEVWRERAAHALQAYAFPRAAGATPTGRYMLPVVEGDALDGRMTHVRWAASAEDALVEARGLISTHSWVVLVGALTDLGDESTEPRALDVSYGIEPLDLAPHVPRGDERERWLAAARTVARGHLRERDLARSAGWLQADPSADDRRLLMLTSEIYSAAKMRAYPKVFFASAEGAERELERLTRSMTRFVGLYDLAPLTGPVRVDPVVRVTARTRSGDRVARV